MPYYARSLGNVTQIYLLVQTFWEAYRPSPMPRLKLSQAEELVGKLPTDQRFLYLLMWTAHVASKLYGTPISLEADGERVEVKCGNIIFEAGPLKRPGGVKAASRTSG